MLRVVRLSFENQDSVEPPHFLLDDATRGPHGLNHDICSTFFKYVVNDSPSKPAVRGRDVKANELMYIPAESLSLLDSAVSCVVIPKRFHPYKRDCPPELKMLLLKVTSSHAVVQEPRWGPRFVPQSLLLPRLAISCPMLFS